MAELRVNGAIDRESVTEFALTIKCFKRKTKAFSLQKTYNKQDPSERQVVIKVLDVDDNLPKFVHENVTLGERHYSLGRLSACTFDEHENFVSKTNRFVSKT